MSVTGNLGVAGGPQAFGGHGSMHGMIPDWKGFAARPELGIWDLQEDRRRWEDMAACMGDYLTGKAL